MMAAAGAVYQPAQVWLVFDRHT